MKDLRDEEYGTNNPCSDTEGAKQPGKLVLDVDTGEGEVEGR